MTTLSAVHANAAVDNRKDDETEITPAERRRQAQLIKLVVGAAYAIGLVDYGYHRDDTIMGLYHLADNLDNIDRRDIPRYEAAAPLPSAMVRTIEELRDIITGSYFHNTKHSGLGVFTFDDNRVNTIALAMNKIINCDGWPEVLAIIPPKHIKRLNNFTNESQEGLMFNIAERDRGEWDTDSGPAAPRV